MGPGGYGPNPYGGAPGGQGPYGQPPQGAGGYGPPPGPGGYGAPPGPPAKKKSALPLILGVVGGVVALGVIGTAVALVVGKKKNVALPVDAKYLPASTKEVATQLIESSRETNESIKSAYLAAELGSEMCRPGASNPAYRLEGLGAGSPKSAKEFFFDKKNLDDVSNLLQCGALLAGAMEDSYQSMIGFEDDEKDTQKHAVAIGRFHVTELPTKLGFSKQSFGPMPGFCRTDVDGDGKAEECTDKSHGAFVKDTTWFMGPKNALEDVAKAVANPKDDLGTSVAALKDAAGETEGLPVVRIRAQPKSSKEFFMSPCYWGALHSGAPFTQFLEGCFPKTADRLVEEVDSKLKAAAYEVDGDVTKAGAFHGNIIFVGRDKDAAKDIEKDVKEIVGDWKSHVDSNEAKLIKASKDNSYSARTKKFAAVADSYFNAFKKMTVARNGRTVKISFNEALTAEDKTALEEAETSTVAKREAVAEIVDALQQKKAVPEKALAKIVGESWAKYLASPPEAPTVSAKFPMSSAECKQVADKLKAVKINDVPGVEGKSAYLTHKYASCATKPPEILASQRDCLLSFKTGAQFAACAPPPGGDKPANEPPESEFGDRAKK